MTELVDKDVTTFIINIYVQERWENMSKSKEDMEGKKDSTWTSKDEIYII